MKYKPKQIGLRHVDWVGLIVSTDLPAHSKLIAYQLSSYMNKNHDVAWPSQARLISECSISNGTLNKNLKLLESEGWITRQPGNSKSTTRYIITFPKALEKSIKKASDNLSINTPSHGVNTPSHGDRVLRHTETKIQEKIPNKIQGKKSYQNIEGLDVDAFEKYLSYRKESKIKKLTQQGEKMSAKKLIELGGDNQMSVVDQSICNGWAGLFELKNPPKEAKFNDEEHYV